MYTVTQISENVTENQLIRLIKEHIFGGNEETLICPLCGGEMESFGGGGGSYAVVDFEEYDYFCNECDHEVIPCRFIKDDRPELVRDEIRVGLDYSGRFLKSVEDALYARQIPEADKYLIFSKG